MKRKHIIIIDNHFLRRAGLEAQLSDNYRVTTALSGLRTYSPRPHLYLVSIINKKDPFKWAAGLPDMHQVLLYGDFTDSLIARLDECRGASAIDFREEINLKHAINSAMVGPYKSRTISRRFAHYEAHSNLRTATRLQKTSPRELEVLKFLGDGYSVREVAEELGVRPTTVETHRQSLRAKLELNNGADMAKYCIREGLIEA